MTQPSHNPSDFGMDFDCVARSDWIGMGFIARDCQQVIERFVHEEVFQHLDQELEFLAPQVSPYHTLPTVQTPRRYTVGVNSPPSLFNSLYCDLGILQLIPLQTPPGSCTLVIAMFNSPFFYPSSIPNLPHRSFYPTDTSNYPSIRNAALQLNNLCISDLLPQCGAWQSAGSRNSIGVFLWGTSSQMDQRVGRAVNGELGLAGINDTVLDKFNETGTQ